VDRTAGIATGYGMDGRGSILGRSKIFVFIASRPALGPTQPPIQWLFPGLGVKLPTYLHLVLRSRMVELYLHSPIYLHDLVLNELSTKKTLRFFYHGSTLTSSPAQTLGSWVRIPLEAWMFGCVCSVFVLSCVGSCLATG
jgi:hypothetical protein